MPDPRVLLLISALATALPPGLPGTAHAESLEEETILLDLLNAERAQAGLPPLRQDPVLTDLARDHARDVRRAGIVSQHSTGDGADFDARLARTPLDVRAAAENVAVATDVLAAHLSVMASTRMRAQALDPALTHAGIGIARGNGSFLIVVEDLAAIVEPPTAEEAARAVREALAGGRERDLLSAEAQRVAGVLAELDTERLDELPPVADAAFTYTSLDPAVIPEGLRELSGAAREVGIGVTYRRTPTRPQGTFFVAVLLRGLG